MPALEETETRFIYNKDNILNSTAEALVNPVNCIGVMGAGLAKQFKDKFPKNFIAYKQACKDGNVSIGKCFIYKEDKYIINFPTKDDWKNPSTYEYIKEGLESLAQLITTNGITSIAIPKIGCGLGGLSWDEVHSQIISTLGIIPCLTVYIYE